MTKTYIAGFEGSPASRAAVELAVRLAEAEDATVVAVNVHPGADREAAEAVLDELEVEGIETRAVRSDSPARGLHELAEEPEVELIVVGATHHGPFGRLAPGSVAMRLLHGAPCRVLVVPRDATASPLRTIGIAYDDSDESRAALHAARATAQRLDAVLVVIGVLETVTLPVAVGYPGMPDIATESEQQFEATLERAAGAVGGSYRMILGSPGRSLAHASADLDMLFTGSRGYGAVGSVLLGSVSRHLVDHAHCPVMVVPRPA